MRTALDTSDRGRPDRWVAVAATNVSGSALQAAVRRGQIPHRYERGELMVRASDIAQLRVELARFRPRS